MTVELGTSPQSLRAAFPMRRRIATYFTGGVEGLSTLSAALHEGGYQVHDLTVDIRDGVAESSVVCTILTADLDQLLDDLRELPTVVSAERL
ncbi:hypothetical protein [Prauserella cavernicola]|uniref:ACT domain-containing protein n=1 Tax=Prauserella cavernicola TaxID=2800127 RepID=A0A934V4G7_9PSEU|nr:hypothetical protein [Prauserella cavernicola]MBK1783568.1 hypothetical protein [Prauserella cavernicola]